MPDITSRIGRTGFFVVAGYDDPIEDSLGSSDLVGPHDQKHIFTGEDAVFGQDIQDGVLREKSLGEINQIGDYLVAGVCPIIGEFKAVGSFPALSPSGFDQLLNMGPPRRIGVILGVGSIGDDEELDVFKESMGSPERIPLVAFYLVEGFPDGNSPSF